MSRPICVIAGDIHYNLNNLELADKATHMAITKANELKVPFIANGDTHDSKANLRGECVNAMIETFKTAHIRPYINIGNHCKISAKGKEHSLNFLAPYANIIDVPSFIEELKLYIIPYFDDVKELRDLLSRTPINSTLIMHQGLMSGQPGDYIKDHSALNPEDLADFRTILSHYHARQDIKCGRPRKGAIGLASYIGNPYTVSFGEANDPPKGFQILMDDGTLEFVPTNLRKHIVISTEIESDWPISLKGILKATNLHWLKIHGAKEVLNKITRKQAADWLGVEEFKLDLIPTDITTNQEHIKSDMSKAQVLDLLIDSMNNSNEQKTRLKELWRRSASN